MAGQYYMIDSALSPSSTPQSRNEMFYKIITSPFSGKIKQHIVCCGGKEDCKICSKIRSWIEIFIKYEKDKNKKLNIGEIMDEDFVEKVFFSDDLMKICDEKYF